MLGGVLTAVLVLATVASLLAAGHFNRLRPSEARAAQNERDARQAAEEAGDAERWEALPLEHRGRVGRLAVAEKRPARRALEAAPEEYRNWEWHYFHNQLDGATLVFSVPDWDRDYQGLARDRAQPGRSPACDGLHQPRRRLVEREFHRGGAGAVLRGHTGHIVHLAYSPDGRQLATAAQDSVRLWDTATGRQSVRASDGQDPTVAYSSTADASFPMKPVANTVFGTRRLVSSLPWSVTCSTA